MTTPLSATPLSATPLSATPLSATPLSATPLSATPLSPTPPLSVPPGPLVPSRRSDRCSPLAAVVERQAGVVSRAQALAAGLAAREVDRHLARRRWHPLHPQVYLVADHPLTDEARVRAAALWAGDGAVVVGAAAVWWHGLAERVPAVVGVAVPRRSPGPRPGVAARRRVLRVDDVVTVHGLAVPVRPLALLDAAVEAGAGGAVLLRRALCTATRSGDVGLAQLHAVAARAGGTASAALLLAGLPDHHRRDPCPTGAPRGMVALSESLQ